MSATAIEAGYTERFVETNGVRLHTIVAGPQDAPLVILLHGFPEFWYGWRKQIGPLAAAGYRVIAPDQRGYNTSDKPRAVSAYALDELARDVVGLIEEAGRERAIIVGHDWGAAVAWWCGIRHPDRVEKLAILNVPHPLVMQRHLRRSLSQIAKSWYVVFFQIPLLPEALMRAAARGPMFAALRRTGRPDAFDDADEEAYRRAWTRPGALKAMLAWYRAAVRYGRREREPLRVPVPVLIVWGMRDRFLGFAMAGMSLDLCDSGRLVPIEEASHWVQHEEPECVNRLLIEFFAEPMK